MTWYNAILIIAGIATALMAIIKLIEYVVKKIKSVVAFFADMKKSIDTNTRHQTETYLTTLRLTIMSDEMPIEERLNAGNTYVQLGGNGAVKAKYKLLQKEYQKQKG